MGLGRRPQTKENYLFSLPKRCLALRFTTDCKEAVYTFCLPPPLPPHTFPLVSYFFVHPPKHKENFFLGSKRCLGLADWKPTVAEGPLLTRPTFGVLLYQVFDPDFPAELQQSNGESARFTGPRNRWLLWLYWTNFENSFTVAATPTWATWVPWGLRKMSTLVGSLGGAY